MTPSSTGRPSWRAPGSKFPSRLPRQNLAFSTATNRIDGYCYDAAGNLLDAGPCPPAGAKHQNIYDAYGNLLSGNLNSSDFSSIMPPDALGHRIAKYQRQGPRFYLYGQDGNPVIEMDGSGTWLQTNVHAGGQFIAQYQGTDTFFLHSDHLGTMHALSNSAGVRTTTCLNLPFGDALTCNGSANPAGYHFTGKERDTESGLDYFGARYYASNMGRWMSPDWADRPEAVPYSSLDNPQSLNLYGYVGNNPLSKADRDGHDPSDLIFDGQAHTVTLVSSDGRTVGSWPAANNVAIHAPAGEGGGYTHGPIQDGTYDINSADSKGATMHLNGPDNGPYGSQGIIHIKDAKGATGDVVVGDGVHSGRNGPESKTAGCVRTTCEVL